MPINCAISMYETKQIRSDNAHTFGRSIYSQCVNGIVVVILCGIYPRIPQEYLGQMIYFFLKILAISDP